MNHEMLDFRAWDKENKCWFEPTYEAYKGNLEELNIGLSGRLSLRTYKGTADESTFPDRFEVTQYTGVKDKKGKKIYGGDIVAFKIGSLRLVSVVKYNADFAVWEKVRGTAQNLGSYKKTTEVIGNIYENPELLK